MKKKTKQQLNYLDTNLSELNSVTVALFEFCLRI